MSKIFKRLVRSSIVRITSCYIKARMWLFSSHISENEIVFVNVNNYPCEYFSQIIEKYHSSSTYLQLYEVYDKWDALLKTPLKTLQAILSARIVVSSGESPVFSALSKDQTLIFLWHACGAFKRMGKNAKANTARKPDWIAVSSEGVRPQYAESFGIPLEHVVPLGVPRTQIFFDRKYLESTKQGLLSKYPELMGKTIYLYAPTYKENPFRSEVGFNLQEFSNLLNENEVLIYKQHPAVIREEKSGNAVSDFLQLDNIRCMDTEDILDLTVLCDTIMTDYSSSFFEAMLLDKPCVFCAKDIDQYERGCYLDYRKDLPGIIVESGKAEDVLAALRKASVNHPNYSKFKEHHLGSCTGDIIGRVVDFLKELGKSK